MRINGRNALACKVLVQDLGSQITVEPLLGLSVIKDFIVDMDPFFDSYKATMPYFVNNDPPADGKEHLQSVEQRERFDDTTKCILCAACTTSCPSFWSDDRYVGPAAIVNAECETITAVGCIISEIPCVDHIPIDQLETGATVRVDGEKGVAEVVDQ